jgi:EAL domain-containing protein (putative c-di-GMP-specific phosphodiesterase class I)
VDELNSRPYRRVLIALDDVCAGDASFLVASQVRVDILKLEKSCVDQITRGDLSSTETVALSSLIRAAKVANEARSERAPRCKPQYCRFQSRS